MATKVDLRKKLIKLSKWRFAKKYNNNKLKSIFTNCLFAPLNFLWYILLSFLWIVYGIIWFFYTIAIKEIATKLIDGKEILI